MNENTENVSKCFSGEAIVLFCDFWEEIKRVQGKDAGKPYIVPESGVISIRFPPEYIGKPVKVFTKKHD